MCRDQKTKKADEIMNLRTSGHNRSSAVLCVASTENLSRSEVLSLQHSTSQEMNENNVDSHIHHFLPVLEADE